MEAEAAFRIHKTDLSLRPIWHQKEDRVQAHILVCFLAYVLWKFLGQLCQRAGLGDEPRRVLAELSELRLVDVILPTRDGLEIRQRCEDVSFCWADIGPFIFEIAFWVGVSGGLFRRGGIAAEFALEVC